MPPILDIKLLLKDLVVGFVGCKNVQITSCVFFLDMKLGFPPQGKKTDLLCMGTVC
jgi:hypothetical protein